MEKNRHVTNNYKSYNAKRKQETRINANIPGQIISNLQLFDKDGKEIGKRNPFKRMHPIKLRNLRNQIKHFA